MGNIVELKTHRDAATASADLRALHDLRDLCTTALVAGGLDAKGLDARGLHARGPTALDLIVAVHRALKGSEWKVRFYRGDDPDR